ncbi:hypothetical protein STEG23_019693 [Scotinomys teguina]
MQTSPEVLHQDLADFRVSHPDLTLLQYVDDILLTAETEQECLQETVIWQPPDRWLSNDRITHYQAMLLNPERIWFGTVTSLNRTTLLPEGGAEAVVEHNFLVGLMAEED